MSEARPLILDDVQSALANMTELGREVTESCAQRIRAAVLNFAVKRGWYVVQHSAYVAWASTAMHHTDNQWVVLDPLFPVAEFGDRARSIRLTRRFAGNETISVQQYVQHNLGARITPLALSNGFANVGIVDDASASGRTLRRVIGAVSGQGGSVVRILVATSAAGAKRSLLSESRSVQWANFVPGDWRVAHLRDGCPYLAHAGRPTDQPPIRGINGVDVHPRVLSCAVVGNLWQVLVLDEDVRRAVEFARFDVVRRLSEKLGRPARVSDLALLGSAVRQSSLKDKW